MSIDLSNMKDVEIVLWEKESPTDNSHQCIYSFKISEVEECHASSTPAIHIYLDRYVDPEEKLDS